MQILETIRGGLIADCVPLRSLREISHLLKRLVSRPMFFLSFNRSIRSLKCVLSCDSPCDSLGA